MDAAPPPGTIGYDRVAHALLAKRLPFEQVHRHISHLFPTQPARILDVGSGPGHDAATLSARGHAVTAVEPTPELREGARKLYARLPIEWIDDSLPRPCQDNRRAAQRVLPQPAFHAATVAAAHVRWASARNWRRVDRRIKWGWVLKQL
jgi:SAM-dependent methyltransferase